MSITQTFGPLPQIIGFTGLRGVGKTEAADVLVKAGYERLHGFGPGKVAAKAYFEACGVDPLTAHRMSYSDLKDQPSAFLPGNATPRYFLERLGKFMGSELGPQWTLGRELEKHRGKNIVVESVVYEADLFLRSYGGKIYRIERPGVEGPKGIHTDEAQAAIQVDGTIINNGSLADLETKVHALIA